MTAGCYDGAEVCELVGFYLLSKLTLLVGTKNARLYWDGSLAVIHQAKGPKMNRIKKEIIALYKSDRLWITTDPNLIETDF